MAFVVGAITASIRGWSLNAVVVHVINEGKQPVNAFVVNYETCGENGQIIGRGIKPGESEYVRFHVCGEGGYDLKIKFSDGSLSNEVGGYIESGYRITVKIAENGVITKRNIFGP